MAAPRRAATKKTTATKKKTLPARPAPAKPTKKKKVTKAPTKKAPTKKTAPKKTSTAKRRSKAAPASPKAKRRTAAEQGAAKAVADQAWAEVLALSKMGPREKVQALAKLDPVGPVPESSWPVVETVRYRPNIPPPPARKPSSSASWPKRGNDEDALAESIIAAYPVTDDWDAPMIQGLLDRGKRRRKLPATWDRLWSPMKMDAVPRTFLRECAVIGRGAEIGSGDTRSELSEPSTPRPIELFVVGNGDLWLCDVVARYWDHEEGELVSDAVPTGSLIACWLLNDEAHARGLADHPWIEEHAAKLCPEMTATIFRS